MDRGHVRRPQKMTLPPEVVDDIERIRDDWQSRHLLRVYMTCLIGAGWRQSCFADFLGLSYQRIQQLRIDEDYVEQSLTEYRAITGMTLPIPDAPIVSQSAGIRGRPRRSARPETMQRIRDLYEQARRYRGGANNRDEAHLFTALVWYAHVSEGASLKAIAEDLDVERTALQSRLIRYGYKTSTGRSTAYRPLRGREPRGRKTHCKRGHPYDEENTLIIATTGDRTCRACARIRARNYQARKRAPLGGAV